MSESAKDNKRIARNTVYMYIRMIITLGLGLYTSRIVLKALGVEDYGLYNVIGGIIAMLSFISGAMTNTTSRFITYYLGQNDTERLRDVFSMAFYIHIIIAIVVLIFGETIGLWYLYEKLVVPEGRFIAALWLYQLSIAIALVNIIYIPYNSAIIAHENMGAFAYISILDAFLKFTIAILITYSNGDKLILYGVLMFSVMLIDIVIYYSYCHRRYFETKLKLFWNFQQFRSMLNFAGWSMFGNFSYMFYSQGLNLILNAFCGPAVNAARGIAVQVESAVRSFANNVQTAINPQIIKSYADNDIDRMQMLVYASSRYCFYLLLLLALPIIIEANFLMDLWLVEVPVHTVNFVRITMIMVLLDALSNPLFIVNLATGKVRIYQITLSVISYAMMPVTFLAMKITEVPESVFLCLFICKVFEQIARVFIVKKQVGIKVKIYLSNVFLPVIKVTLLSIILPFSLYKLFSEGWICFVVVVASCIVSVLLSVYLLGVNSEEKVFILCKCKYIISNTIEKYI